MTIFLLVSILKRLAVYDELKRLRWKDINVDFSSQHMKSNASVLPTLKFLSALFIVLLTNLIVCFLSSSWRCSTSTPTANEDTSVSVLNKASNIENASSRKDINYSFLIERSVNLFHPLEKSAIQKSWEKGSWSTYKVTDTAAVEPG